MTGVVALIAVLAVLQYRSIVQASRAERARLAGELQASLVRFTQEFDGEINRVVLAANGAGPGPPDRRLDEPAARIAGWQAATPYRNLVRAFYRSEGGRLYRFDAERESFEPAEWPASLAELPKMGPPVQVISTGGGIVILGRHLRPGGFRPGGPPPQEEAAGAWSAIELNLDFIAHDMLPRLVAKHFAPDYAVQVASSFPGGEPRQVLYSSSPDAGSGKPDASTGLFEMRLEGGGAPGFGGGRRGGGRGAFLRQPPPPGQDPDPGRRGMWEIRARHNAGSLAAAAAQSRNRDLAVSAVVLLLLLASVAALAVVTRRAQRLAALQMEFVSGVSHELRTPLAVIGSAADNLADGVVANEAQVRRYGALIRGEGRRLTEMIEQVLSYSSLQSGLQSGKKRMERRPVEIADVIDRAIAACAGQIEESRCSVEREIPAGLPRVAADEASLIHCIANLLGNALKYGEPGHQVRITATTQPGSVEIRVSDTGFGIDGADLPHIFDAFYRGRSVAEGTIRGTGLGLSLVRRIVEAHDGTVNVESTTGMGSCFTLRLPVAGGEVS